MRDSLEPVIPAALVDAELASEKRYWLDKLSGGIAPSGIPGDFRRDDVFAGRTGVFVSAIPRETQELVLRVCNNNPTLVLASLISAAQLCLFRYTGIEDVVVGTPIHEEHADLAALNKIVPIRTEVAGAMSFKELLLSVKNSLSEAYANQKYPFERIIEILSIAAPPGQCPLFNLVVLIDGINNRANIRHLRHDLTLAFNIDAGRLSGEIEYNERLFRPETIEAFAGHYAGILGAMFESPDGKVEELDLVSDDERIRLIHDFNSTRVPYPRTKTVRELFEEQAARSPMSVAVSLDDEHVTYEALNARANQLANYLARAGVGPDVPAALFLERSIDLVIAMLAVVKAGGAYIPLDTDWPNERLASILADAGSPIVLTHEQFRDKLTTAAPIVCCLDSNRRNVADESGDNPSRPSPTDKLAYVIFTSGSTGRPKGVMVNHEGLCNHMVWMQRDYPLTPRDRVLQKTPYTFDASVWEFYLPLLAGGTLVMAKPGGHLDSGYMTRAVREQSISVIQLVPTMLDLFIEEEAIEGCTALRTVFCGGEALTPELQDRVFARLDAELVNLYGPTETTVQTVVWKCERGVLSRLVPIGRPISNTQVYLLDRLMNNVPIGMAGELYLGGICVGRGYLNRADLTAERFLPDLLSDAPGARLYRTSDLARYTHEGVVEYLGRLDHQVKFRGFRIELEEIEAVLNRHPAIRGAIVTAAEYAPGQSHLAAYLVCRKRSAPTFTELRNYAQESLPNYMIPSTFVLLRSLPLLPNGKVNRRALPEMEALRPELEVGFVSPRNESERILAEIWKEVLQVERVGVLDNFFDLGGHSLLMFQMHAKLRKEFDRDLSTIDLFKYPTVSALAEYLSSEREEAPSFTAEEEQARKQRQAIERRRQIANEAGRR